MILLKEDFSSGKFETGNLGSEKPWFYYEQPSFLARDPASKVSVKDNELTVNIPKYTLTTVGVHDHVKFLFFRNVMNKETGFPGFKVPEKGALYCKAKVSFNAFGTEKNPFGVSADDYRLSSAISVNLDYDTFIVYDFVMAKTKIYALYERLPFDPKVKDPAAFFTYAMPVKDIEPGSEHKLKTVYDKAKYKLTWYVDDKKAFSINEFGRRLGKDFEECCVFKDQCGSGNPDKLPLVQSNQRLYGMGLFTLLDAGARQNRGLVDIYDPKAPNEKKLFGQGGKFAISDFEVGTV